MWEQERCQPLPHAQERLTFDRVLDATAAQEAEQELLARVQPALRSVGRGYSVALLLRGREREAPRLVPQLLQMLFEEAGGGSAPGLSTLSLVQLSSHGKARDLLSPGAEEVSVLHMTPLGVVVEDAREVEVSDPRVASELYLQASGGDGRDCPLLQVLAGEVADEKEEGSLPWIVSCLLEGNNYSGLLLRVDPQGSSLSLLQAALCGALRRRTQVKLVHPTLWNAVQEARARRLGLKNLRSGLLGDTLTHGRLSQLARALQELRVNKVTGVATSHSPGLQGQLQGRASLGHGLHQKHLPSDSEEEVPDVPLQFFLAQVRRQRLREQHQVLIQEELKHLEQEEEEEVADDQVESLVAGEDVSKARQGWHREQMVLRLQLEAVRVERDTAEQDLAALYELHVCAARAQTRHVLQVFQAWRELWADQVADREHRHCSLLAGVLQDAINLATQNQELQAQNLQLHGVQTNLPGAMSGSQPGESSENQETFGESFRFPHSSEFQERPLGHGDQAKLNDS
ncbi:uncharacterized protein LOC130033082 [Sorex fumeus]|uniref:uncharacterized protein LOC130033082 n=1 Tax=Sorex fumeus TaxID=62283 RepID=UPI0024ACEDAA|nr:uncharacterized protein LOC130033082 [Sorex fumeus]